jgi:hypothetical protein
MAEESMSSQRSSRIEINRSAEIHLELDDDKIEAIKRCLENGRLSISFSNVDLNQVGRMDGPYIYD